MMDSTTTTDRELVELAAVAAGIHGVSHWGDNPIHRGIHVGGVKYWNPLNDDSDCARMEAAVEIHIGWQADHVIAAWRAGDRPSANDVWTREYFKDYRGDKNAARRRASTRTAAEIGRSQHG